MHRYLLNDKPVVLAEFLDQEFDDDTDEGPGETHQAILALQPGESIRFGGGAAQEFELRCEAADSPSLDAAPWEGR
jgi:hypothetical protein